MGSLANGNLRLCGSHGGVSVGEDGSSDMELEDFSMIRAIHGSTVLSPCDAVQTAALVEQMIDLTGTVYLRTMRGAVPVIYGREDFFPIGGSKTLRSSSEDAVTIVATGVTVHEALDAYEQLKKIGIICRVIDAYSIKPIDEKALREASHLTGHLVVVEDHWREGGLGDAVLESLADSGMKNTQVTRLAVSEIPGSGSASELLRASGIDAEGIVSAVRAEQFMIINDTSSLVHRIKQRSCVTLTHNKTIIYRTLWISKIIAQVFCHENSHEISGRHT
jgi:transketolase